MNEDFIVSLLWNNHRPFPSMKHRTCERWVWVGQASTSYPAEVEQEIPLSEFLEKAAEHAKVCPKREKP